MDRDPSQTIEDLARASRVLAETAEAAKQAREKTAALDAELAQARDEAERARLAREREFQAHENELREDFKRRLLGLQDELARQQRAQETLSADLHRDAVALEAAERKSKDSEARAREAEFQSELTRQKLRQAEVDAQIYREQTARLKAENEGLSRLRDQALMEAHRQRALEAQDSSAPYRRALEQEKLALSKQLEAVREALAQTRPELEQLRREKAFLALELTRASSSLRGMRGELEIRRNEGMVALQKIARLEAELETARKLPMNVELFQKAKQASDPLRKHLEALERNIERLKNQLFVLPAQHPERSRREAQLDALTREREALLVPKNPAI